MSPQLDTPLLDAKTSRERRSIHRSKLRGADKDLRQERKAETIARYAADIGERGIQNALHVFPLPDGNFEILTGTTRFLAGCEAGLDEFPCEIHPQPPTEEGALLHRLLDEDMHTELSPIEEATAYLRLMEINRWNQAQLAKALKKNPTGITRGLSILNHFPQDLHADLGEGDGKVHPATAYQLSRLHKLSNGEEIMRKLAEKAKKGLLTRDQAEKKVQALLDEAKGKKPRKGKPTKFTTPGGIVLLVPPDTDYDAVIEELKNALSRVKKGKKIGECDEESAPVLLPV